MEVIAKRYIKALVDKADSETKKEYYEVIEGFCKAYANKEIAQVLNSPLVENEKKVQLVKTVLNDANDSIKNFMTMVAQNDRFDAIPAMAKVLRLELQKESNQYEGTIVSNKSMSESEVSSLQDSLSKKTGTEVKLTQISSDYDGIKVEIPDLGIEVGYSKDRVKNKLIDYITKSF